VLDHGCQVHPLRSTDHDRLEAIAKDIESLTATVTLQVAERLAEARNIFRYRHDEGGFGGWVETRLGYSRQTAYSLVHVHERFGGQKCLKSLDTLARSVLFLISAPSCPPEVRDTVTARAQAGERVRVDEVKEALEKAKGRTEIIECHEASETLPTTEVKRVVETAPSSQGRKRSPKEECRAEKYNEIASYRETVLECSDEGLKKYEGEKERARREALQQGAEQFVSELIANNQSAAQQLLDLLRSDNRMQPWLTAALAKNLGIDLVKRRSAS
jgi:hypothetical protein